jgi:hypothetical protein
MRRRRPETDRGRAGADGDEEAGRPGEAAVIPRAPAARTISVDVVSNPESSTVHDARAGSAPRRWNRLIA